MASIPLERSALPYVDVADEENQHEDEHFDEEESRGQRASAHKDHRPRDEKDSLDVEQDEEDGDQVELHRKPLVRATERRHAALVRPFLHLGGAPRAEEMR